MIINILGEAKTAYYEGGTVDLNRSSKANNTCGVTFVTQASTYLPQVGQDIKVYDNDSNLYFGGIISKVAHSEFTGGNSSDALVRSSLYSDGYNSIPERRTITASFSTSYAGDIVKYILNNVLNDDTYSENLSTGGNIENGAYYTQYNKGISSVKEILDQLADASGFTWYIDNDKALNFEAETTTPAAAHEIMSTGSYKNFYDVQIANSLSNYRNKQYVIGDVGEDGIAVVGMVQESTGFTARQAIEGGSTWSSGVYGNVIQDSNVKTTADAVTLATNELKQNNRTGELSFASYSLDWDPLTKLKVKLPKYGIDEDTYYLITNVNIQSQTQNREIAVIDAIEKDNTDFGSQVGLDSLKFMTELVQAAKGGGAGGGSVNAGGGGSVSVNDYAVTTTAQVDIGSTEVTVLSKSITLDVKADVKTFVSMKGLSDDALDVTLKTYQDAAARTYQPKTDIYGANDVVVTYSDTITSLAAGTYTIAVKGITSNGNFVIPTGFANLNILAIPLISETTLADVTNFVATVNGFYAIDLTWSNPDALNFTGVEVYSYATTLENKDRTWCDANATLEYSGALELFDDTGLAADTFYHYKIFAVYSDNGTYYSLGVSDSETTPIVVLGISTYDSLEHDTSLSWDNSLLMINSTHFWLAYHGGSSDGTVKTFTIDGSFDVIQTDSLVFSALAERYLSSVEIDSTHYVVAHTSSAYKGRLHFFSIDGSYQITDLAINYEFADSALHNSMVLIDSTHLMIAYAYDPTLSTQVRLAKGRMITLSFDGAYAPTEIQDMEQDAVHGSHNSLVKIDATHYALAYESGEYPALTGKVKIFSINGNYEKITELSSITHYNYQCRWNSLVLLDATHLALAYGGATSGHVSIFAFDVSYDLELVDTIEHDSAFGAFNSLAVRDSDYLVLAYAGSGSDGYMKVFNINAEYELSENAVLEHDENNGISNSLVKIATDDWALTYGGLGDDGYFKTFEIKST